MSSMNIELIKLRLIAAQQQHLLNRINRKKVTLATLLNDDQIKATALEPDVKPDKTPSPKMAVISTRRPPKQKGAVASLRSALRFSA